jgi:NAD(P)-dependent dehydrogenase (short-subunit alcohol dehydrogenase family)
VTGRALGPAPISATELSRVTESQLLGDARDARVPVEEQCGADLLAHAAGGIGGEICDRLDALGFRIAAVDLSAEAIGALARRLTRPVLALTIDLCNPGAPQAIADAVQEHFGRCDVLINNAGVVLVDPFESVDPAKIERELRVNLVAPALLTRALFPLLQAAGDGHVISVASLGGLLPLAECPSYSASKFGLRGLMLALAMRRARTGVRISIVNPSSVDTTMLQHEAMHGGSPLNFLDPPQAPTRVAEAVIDALSRSRIERDVPASDGWLIRIVMSLPNLFARVMPWLVARGERGRRRYLRAKGLERVA